MATTHAPVSVVRPELFRKFNHVPAYEIVPVSRSWLERIGDWLHRRVVRRFVRWNSESMAFLVSQLPIMFGAVAAMVRLGGFEALLKRPQSLEELAETLQVDAHSLVHILRPLLAMHFIDRDVHDIYSIGPLGREYTSQGRQPFAAWVELVDRIQVPVMSQLPDAIRAGEPLTRFVYHKTCWEVMAEHPGTCELHDVACGRWTELCVDEVAKCCDFSNVKTLIDIGGGRGAFLAAMLRAAPHVSGAVYDRQETHAAAGEMFCGKGVADRAEHLVGNFFEEVPAGRDLYTIKHVLHDWDDESVRKILSNIRRAMSAHSKLLIVEGSVDHNVAPGEIVRSLFDLHQYAATWGCSRTFDEFARLCADSGLHLQRVIPTRLIDPQIMECVPA
ncbi:O-methyltransferase family 2 [Planctopirus limnophila DSM 3776]|uniref:O-methyltransferase family 2 n=1 Tax=Planctopirus limnophila (strain ATCC 43296 / DSM 3776 / IFAM 1008 / Mu 290) TaxID=521674 RepID=D5SWS7_PLAL2|nr:O-methyltransferase family 2 [Planctopirus limnophila DSM 3776]